MSERTSHVSHEYLTESEKETRRVGRNVGREAAAGDVVLVTGPLGAGKTAFVRGMAEGLRIHPDEVSSPTFTLVHEYRGGRLPLFHADLYRLETVARADLGLDEKGVVDGVLAIEWPERLTDAYAAAVLVEIAIVDQYRRRIVIGRPERRGEPRAGSIR